VNARVRRDSCLCFATRIDTGAALVRYRLMAFGRHWRCDARRTVDAVESLRGAVTNRSYFPSGVICELVRRCPSFIRHASRDGYDFY
jgi:hypothetical protein